MLKSIHQNINVKCKFSFTIISQFHTMVKQGHVLGLSYTLVEPTCGQNIKRSWMNKIYTFT